jgi:hypothetical protein
MTPVTPYLDNGFTIWIIFRTLMSSATSSIMKLNEWKQRARQRKRSKSLLPRLMINCPMATANERPIIEEWIDIN